MFMKVTNGQPNSFQVIHNLQIRSEAPSAIEFRGTYLIKPLLIFVIVRWDPECLGSNLYVDVGMTLRQVPKIYAPAGPETQQTQYQLCICWCSLRRSQRCSIQC
jgi:hypothetical protein